LLPRRPILAITLGDPCGVGAEVAVKALALPWAYAVSRPLLVGHPAVVARALAACAAAGTLARALAVREVAGPAA
jgi:4-hydroxythreonine-4-phosphate dehydrogenase